MKIVALKPESDVKKTIEEFTQGQDHYECVLLVAINKDGTQYMQNSSMTTYQKSFLSQFIQASIFWWFRDLSNE